MIRKKNIRNNFALAIVVGGEKDVCGCEKRKKCLKEVFKEREVEMNVEKKINMFKM